MDLQFFDNLKLEDGWSQKNKIISLDAAKNIVSKLKKEGKVVGMTNGCFDCCHMGHVYSFMQAKELCDVLIVALNSDISVKSIKGEGRPIQDEKTRAIVLASFPFIDYVILFDEDSPIKLLDTLRPQIVAKEGYSIDKWIEAKFIMSYGGKPVILKRFEGYSTTDLVNKMKKVI